MSPASDIVFDSAPTHVIDITEACSKANHAAYQEARRNLGRKGMLISRGRWLAFTVEKGGKKIGVYEGESRRWDGTKKDLLSAQVHAKQYGTVVCFSIFGGFNYADSLEFYNNGNYDALVSEWQVTIEGEFK